MKNKSCQNLILFGYKSSGKTFLGTLLARDLGCIFIDTDQLIEQLYHKEYHLKSNCREISLKLGEEGFRKMEKKVIKELEQISNSVIALGGGAVLDSENCQLLKKLGTLIYLKVDKEVIKRRIFSSGIPSFLDLVNPEKAFDKMYEERAPIYEKVSEVKLQIDGKTNQQIIEQLKVLLDISTHLN